MAIKLFLLLAAVSLSVEARIPNVAVVENQITRGGHPDLNELHNFKTIISLEAPSKPVEAEKKKAQELGINFINSSMDVHQAPEDSQVNAIIAIMKDPKNQPLLIHCFHGEDRTGLIVGLYRVYVDGWTQDAAYQEMLKMGFHKKFTSLRDYFYEKTNSP
jgi:protein tyrosine/serine phosphatase